MQRPIRVGPIVETRAGNGGLYMFGLSATHLIILLIIVLIIFGGGKLPDLGRQLGTAINEFKNSVRPQDDSDKPTTPPNDKQA